MLIKLKQETLTKTCVRNEYLRILALDNAYKLSFLGSCSVSGDTN